LSLGGGAGGGEIKLNVDVVDVGGELGVDDVAVGIGYGD
jgi:hypothetical protein